MISYECPLNKNRSCADESRLIDKDLCEGKFGACYLNCENFRLFLNTINEIDLEASALALLKYN